MAAKKTTFELSSLDPDLQARMKEVFKLGSQDQNGQDVYSNTKVHLGHLDVSKRMYIPDTFWTFAESLKDYDVDLEKLGEVNGVSNYLGDPGDDYAKECPYLTELKTGSTVKQVDIQLVFWQIVAMNFDSLCQAGLTPKTAAYAALFRARWATTGGLVYLANSKMDGASEVVKEKTGTSGYGPIVAATTIDEIFELTAFDFRELFTVLNDSDGGFDWVIGVAENMFCAVEHVFRVRSHHFKTTGSDGESYRKLYDTYMNACYEGNFKVPDGFDWFSIAHTAIHPFKIEALAKTAAHYVAHNLVADAAIIRFNGSPVGNAMITTTCAAMDTMAAEVWYEIFEKMYSKQIVFLRKSSYEINNNKYRFHMAAGLYGVSKLNEIVVDGEVFTVDIAKSSISMLGSAASGLIGGLSTAIGTMKDFKFALSNAKALKKAAEANPMLCLRIRELVLKSLDAVNDSVTMADAIEAALPNFERMTSGAKSTALALAPP